MICAGCGEPLAREDAVVLFNGGPWRPGSGHLQVKIVHRDECADGVCGDDPRAHLRVFRDADAPFVEIVAGLLRGILTSDDIAGLVALWDQPTPPPVVAKVYPPDISGARRVHPAVTAINIRREREAKTAARRAQFAAAEARRKGAI